MIKHLKGIFETVDFAENMSVLLYKNKEYENYPIHWHNAVEIIMPMESTYTVTVNRVTYQMNEFDIIIIPPGELHELFAPPTGKRLIFLCEFSLINNAAALSSILPVLNQTTLITPQSGEKLHGTVRALFLEIYRKYEHADVLMEAEVYARLIQMLIAIRKNSLISSNAFNSVSTGKQKEYVEKFSLVTKYIDENYMEDISLDTLADLAGYSRYHFSRMFRQYNNVSYTDYINQKRIKVAETLLINPALSITEVAMQSGFSSITTFNRIFKEVKQCTPSDFKKLYRTNNKLRNG